MAENNNKVETKITLAVIHTTLGQMTDNQKSMQADVSEIKNKLFDPDTGLYVRVMKNTRFRKVAVKHLWFLYTVVSAGIIGGIIRIFLIR